MAESVNPPSDKEIFPYPGKPRSTAWKFFGFHKLKEGPPSKENLDMSTVICKLCCKSYANKTTCTKTTYNTEQDGDASSLDMDQEFLGYEKYNVKVNKNSMRNVLLTAKTAEKCALGLLELILTKEEVQTITINGNKQYGKEAMEENKREALKAEVFKKFPQSSWEDIVVSLNDKIRNFRRGKYNVEKLSKNAN